MVLQLETGPTGRSSGCFSTGLEPDERLCQSPMVPDRSCPQQDQNTTSSSGHGSPSLEEPGIVSSSPGNADGLASFHPATRELVAERTGSQRGQDHRELGITPQLAVWSVSREVQS